MVAWITRCSSNDSRYFCATDEYTMLRRFPPYIYSHAMLCHGGGNIGARAKGTLLRAAVAAKTHQPYMKLCHQSGELLRE